MSYREYCSWAAYRRKHGSLDVGRRLDRTLTIIASHFASAFIKYRGGKKPKPDMFTLYPEQPPAKEKTGSVDDQLISFFTSMKGKK